MTSSSQAKLRLLRRQNNNKHCARDQKKRHSSPDCTQITDPCPLSTVHCPLPIADSQQCHRNTDCLTDCLPATRLSRVRISRLVGTPLTLHARMASVSLRPSPTARTMTSRRVPLANLPNATNSPYRDAAAPGTKRARSHAGDQRELAYAQPPAKKLMLEADHEETRRHALPRKTSQNPPTALQRKLEAARDSRTTETRPMSRATEKAQKASQDNLESIRQWQRHYKKIFPQIVFYYESIPEDMRSRISRRVQTLGAVSDAFEL